MAKRKVIRGGQTILGSLGSGTGDPILTKDTTTGEVGEVSAVDSSTFLSTTLANGTIYIGNASNVATSRAVTGDVLISNLGVTSIAPNTIVDADIFTAAGISYGKLNLANSIVNNDIATAANIARTKLAAGNVNRVLINNGSGVFSEATAITASRVLLSDANGIPVASTVTTTAFGYYDPTSSIQTQLNNRLQFSSAITPATGDLLQFTGGSWTNLAVGSAGYVLTSDGTNAAWAAGTSNGLPTGGTADQYLSKIDGTDYNTQWTTLTLAKVTDVTATVAQVNALATGFYDATSSVQTQINLKLSTSLAYNAIFLGNVSNTAGQLSPGSDGTVLTIVAGVPTWTPFTPGTGSVTSVDVSGGSTGLTFTGGPVSTTGTITASGTLVVASGGTGRTTNTAYALLAAGTTSTGALQQVSGLGTSGQVLTSAGAGALPTWQTPASGFTNPMTTAGDLIIATGGGTPARLAIGANTYVLTSNGTTASWQASTGSITGSGTSGQVTYWNGTSTITSEAAFSYNATDDILTVPRLHLTAQASDPVATLTDGDIWYNSTALDIFGRINGRTSSLTRIIYEDVSTTTYTFVEEDRNKFKRFTHASGCTATIPTGLSNGWLATAYRALGAGAVIFSSAGTYEGSGSTLDSEKTGATIYHRGGNVHVVLGAVGVSAAGWATSGTTTLVGSVLVSSTSDITLTTSANLNLGGANISLAGSVFLPTSISNDNALVRVLVADASTGQVKYRTASTIGGDMYLASTQTNSGAKTFLDSTLLVRNVANTFSSTFTNVNTAARTYTLPNFTGSIVALEGNNVMAGGITNISGSGTLRFSNNDSGTTLQVTPSATLNANGTLITVSPTISIGNTSSSLPTSLSLGGSWTYANTSAKTSLVKISPSVALAGFSTTELYGIYYAPIITGSGSNTHYAAIFESGRIGVNTLTPTARLMIAAGTATANTAPLKLVTGTALTTPEDGAMEYHSSHLYYTIGSTRYQLDQQTLQQALTASGVISGIQTISGSGLLNITNNSSEKSIVLGAGVTGAGNGGILTFDNVIGTSTTGGVSSGSSALMFKNSTTAGADNVFHSHVLFKNAFADGGRTNTTFIGTVYDPTVTVTGTGTKHYAQVWRSGTVGLGVDAPTAMFHVKAGTATAGTAPIKLTTGTALSSIEDGALEYHSSHLYFSIGSTRYQLDQQGGISGLTSGRVPYANSSTTITDEAGFEYDAANNRLTVQTLRLGTASVAGDRTIDAVSSDADSSILLAPQNAGNIYLKFNTGFNLYMGDSSTTSGNTTRGVVALGAATNITIGMYAKGTGNVILSGDSDNYQFGSSTLLMRKKSTGTYTFSIKSGTGDTLANSGDHLSVIAGSANNSVGNGDGGSLLLQSGLGNGSGVAGNITIDSLTGYLIISTIPTSSAGLPSGAVWANSNVLTIVP